MVGRRGFGSERPEAARRVLRALLRAEALFLDDLEDARRTMARELGDEADQLGELPGRFEFRVRLDQSLLVLLEEEARWVRRTGQPPGQAAPSFLEALDAAPLLAVKPARVGLIR